MILVNFISDDPCSICMYVGMYMCMYVNVKSF